MRRIRQTTKTGGTFHRVNTHQKCSDLDRRSLRPQSCKTQNITYSFHRRQPAELEQVLKIIWEECVANATLVTMGRPKFIPKTAPYPSTIITPSNIPIPRPTPLTTPNGIRIQSAVLPQVTFADQQMGQANVLYHYCFARYADGQRRANNTETAHGG